MKKKTLTLVTLCAVLLTGCGTNFEISGSDLQDYAAANDGQYADVSDQFDYDYLDSCYVLEVGKPILSYGIWTIQIPLIIGMR